VLGRLKKPFAPALDRDGAGTPIAAIALSLGSSHIHARGKCRGFPRGHCAFVMKARGSAAVPPHREEVLDETHQFSKMETKGNTLLYNTSLIVACSAMFLQVSWTFTALFALNRINAV
jgi:hypothetical protein